MPKKQEDTVQNKGLLMTQKKLTPAIALTISLELMLAPLPALAQSKQPAPAEKDKAEKIFNTASKVLEIGTGVYNNYRGVNPGGMSSQFQTDMQALERQRAPLPDKYFNPSLMAKIPGLNEYLALNNINPQQLNCSTLPTTLYDAQNESCRVGFQSDTGMAQSDQLNEMFSYYNQYTQIEKTYMNYTETSNVGGQLYGVGCMKNAMQVLNGFFKYRIDELDKLSTNLEAIQNQFREASRMDLEAIEESTALLDGGNSGLDDKVKTKKPKLFEFGQRFDNPACRSMFAPNNLNETGLQAGLNGISKQLKETLNTQTGEPVYSGLSYASSHNNVVNDINSLAEKVAKQVELNFEQVSAGNGYSNFVRGLSNDVSSTTNVHKRLNADLFADIQTKFQEKNSKLQTQKSELESEFAAAGIDSSNATKLLNNLKTGNFEAEVNRIENGLKNNCLMQSMSGLNPDVIRQRTVDPKASKFANKNSSSTLPDEIWQAVSNPSTSFETKLEKLQSLNKNSRYYFKMEQKYDVQEVNEKDQLVTREIHPTMKRHPTAYFTDLIKNCEAQYKVNKLGSKLSGKDAIKKLRTLNAEYKSLAKNHAQEIKNEVRKKLIDCGSNEIANSSTVGSCTPERFNTQSPKFCAKAAFSCSQNMQQCSMQAEKFVEELKTDRNLRVTNYKALMEKNKRDIVKVFDSALARFMREGELMRGAFGVGFSSPNGIEREVPEGGRYLSSFEQGTEKLKLENPEEYVKMFQRNIGKLKQSVSEQQSKILGGDVNSHGGILAQHMRDTEKNYDKVIGQAKTAANSCLKHHDGYLAQQEAGRAQANAENQKMQAELGEKLPTFCTKYKAARDGHPNKACSGDVSDLAKSAMKAAHQAGDRTAANSVTEFEAMCDGFNNESPASIPDNDTMCAKIKENETADFKWCQTITEDLEKDCPLVSSVVDNKTVFKRDCSNFKTEQITRRYQLYKNEFKITTAAPAFCEAGDNSGNYATKSVEGIIKSLGGAPAVQAQAVR
jgi:hypothetical protein